MELIYPRRFKLPETLQTTVDAFHMHTDTIYAPYVLKACRFKGHIIISFNDSSIHKYSFNYRTKRLMVHMGAMVHREAHRENKIR